uniref:Uncharacterized protein n=1 Tax=Abalone asfa-like virus TaxID=2839893 RepID=A0A5K7XYP2_9VIRU|nr:hypothetical protein [Abalone asfa-like virus]
MSIFIQTLKTEDVETNSLLLTGGTMKGSINMGDKEIINLAGPSTQDSATTKTYVDVEIATRYAKAGGEISGDVNMTGHSIENIKLFPTTPSSAVSKSYTDNKVASCLPKSGGQITGEIDMGVNEIKNMKNPSTSASAVTKYYTDNKIALCLPKSGGQMTGEIDMSAKEIKNLGYPTTLDSATTKAFVDTKLSLAGGTMRGNIDMGGKEIINLSQPTTLNSAVTKDYVDLSVRSRFEKRGGYISGEVDMGNNEIKNLKYPSTPESASTKSYADHVITKCLAKSGGTMSGEINMSAKEIKNLGYPTTLDSATTKAFVDTAIEQRMKNLTDGLGIVGELDMKGEEIKNVGYPTSAHSAATRDFVNTSIHGRLSRGGGVMEGYIDMGQKRIINIAEPIDNNDVVNKQYLNKQPVNQCYPLLHKLSDIDARIPVIDVDRTAIWAHHNGRSDTGSILDVTMDTDSAFKPPPIDSNSVEVQFGSAEPEVVVNTEALAANTLIASYDSSTAASTITTNYNSPKEEWSSRIVFYVNFPKNVEIAMFQVRFQNFLKKAGVYIYDISGKRVPQFQFVNGPITLKSPTTSSANVSPGIGRTSSHQLFNLVILQENIETDEFISTSFHNDTAGFRRLQIIIENIVELYHIQFYGRYL